MNISEFFSNNGDEFLKSYKDPEIKDIIHDLFVFNKLAPFVERGDLICASSRDEIFFNVDPEQVFTSLTSYELIKLIRCGLRYSEDQECFVMFT